MKNSVIYALMGLMLISLIGIIGVQAIWITDAFTAGEREYTTHVHDALNAVNDAIDNDEAALFIEERFGGVDSLLHQVFISNSDAGQQQIIVQNSGQANELSRIRIQVEKDSVQRDDFEEDQQMIWNERFEVRYDNVDSALKNALIDEEKVHDLSRVSDVVRRMTTERIYGGKLDERIMPDSLKVKVEQALKQEGIEDRYEFGVYNKHEKRYDTDFSTKGFQTKKKAIDFKKDLFKNDRSQKGLFALHIQFNDRDAYVWTKVRPMLILSLVFSMLILLCFGYSVYFIFKQKRISQVKNDFINNMTHELKTPLASISLAASSIRHPQVIERPEEIKRFADIISDEERKINAHIEQVLEIASLDRSEMQLNFENCELPDLLNKSLRTIELSLKNVEGHVIFDTIISKAPIQADALHLINVFTNILDNSIKYSEGRPKIVVELRVDAHEYCVSIRDSGIGMSSSEQKQAFDKFYRAERGDIHNRKGFGLGLSYVKSIVEAHQGRVEIQSEKNVGTTVFVYIPKRV